MYSPVAKKAFLCIGSVNVAENSSRLDDTSLMNATTSPICIIEDYEKSQISGTLLDTAFEQENSQSLLEINLKTNKNPSDIFDIIDDIPETPKSVENISLTTPKKALQNRSPLLPTQPLLTACSAPMQQRPRVRSRVRTLDSRIDRFNSSPKSKSVSADEDAPWLNIKPNIPQEIPNFMTKVNNENAGVIISDVCSSQILSQSLIDSTGIRPVLLNSNSRELGKLKPNTVICKDENLSKFLQISPQISSRLNAKQISKRMKKLQNCLIRPAFPATATGQAETNEDEQEDIISSVSDESSFPLTPSPPYTLRKPEILRQVSLTTVLGRSNTAEYYAGMESQHTRSLMRAISSPKFCRNDQKYVDNELTSRFNDDGKVRRKKAERRLLHGFECRCCTDYYESLGLNQDERNKRVDQVCPI